MEKYLRHDSDIMTQCYDNYFATNAYTNTIYFTSTYAHYFITALINDVILNLYMDVT